MLDGQAAKWVNAIPPAIIKDNAAYTAAVIDTLGWDYAEVAVFLGATDIAAAVLKIDESDVSFSGESAVLTWGTDLDIAGATSTLPSAANDNGIFLFQLDLRKRKRYLRLAMTAGDGTAGTYAAAIARLSRGEVMPVTATEAGCIQILRA